MCRARLGLPLNAIKIGSSVCCLEGDWRAEDTCKRPIACVISSFGGSALVQYFAMLLASSLVSKNPIQCLVVCNKTRLYCMYCLSSRAADLQWWPIIGGLLYSRVLPILRKHGHDESPRTWASGPYWVSQCTSHAAAVAAARLWSFLVTITVRTMLLTLGTSVGPSIRTRVR